MEVRISQGGLLRSLIWSQLSKEVMDIGRDESGGYSWQRKNRGKGWGSRSRKAAVLKLRGQKPSEAK